MSGSEAESAAAKLKAEGNAFFKAGEHEKALAKYKQACDLCPSVAAYWSNAAACHEKLKSYKKMKKAAKKCLEADDTYVKGYYRLAKSQLVLEELTDALETVQLGMQLGENVDDFRLLKLQIEEDLDESKCLNCGKAETSTVCGNCRSASYCSVDCQIAHRSEHKKTCHKPGETVGQHCANCREPLLKGKQNPVCPKCGVTRYCSRKCIFEHRPKHESICRFNQSSDNAQRVISPAEEAAKQLFNEWKLYASDKVHDFGTYAMTKKEFMQQPPEFVICCDIQFDYNHMTFLPRDEPRLVRLTALPNDLRNIVLEGLQETHSKPYPDSDRTHMFIKGCFIDGRKYAFNAIANSIKPVSMAPCNFQCVPRDRIRSWIRNNVVLNLGQLRLWRDQSLENFQLQTHAVVDADDDTWHHFLVHALRIYSKKPRHKTHVIVIDCEPGYGLGQIGSLQRYSVLKVEDVRAIFRMDMQWTEEMVQLCFDLENSPRIAESRVANNHPRMVLLPVVFRQDYGWTQNYGLESTMYWVGLGIPQRLPKVCDTKANAAFRRLQSFALPEVSSPDLASVKADMSWLTDG